MWLFFATARAAFSPTPSELDGIDLGTESRLVKHRGIVVLPWRNSKQLVAVVDGIRSILHTRLNAFATPCFAFANFAPWLAF